MDGTTNKEKKKGGRMRTITFSSKSSTDKHYQKGVKKLEQEGGIRGGYVIGEGALNRGDTLFMMEQEERRRAAEQRLKDEEASKFQQMVMREKSLKNVEEEVESDSDEKGKDADADAVADAVGGNVPAAPLAKKRRRTAKELLRGVQAKRKTENGDDKEKDKDTDKDTEKEKDKEREDDGEDGDGVNDLFAAYGDDSD